MAEGKIFALNYRKESYKFLSVKLHEARVLNE